MYSSSRRRVFSDTIQIMLIFGCAAYFTEAIMPLSINKEREHDFPKGSEFLAPNYHTGNHFRTGMRQDEASRQRQKTVLVNTGRINVKFVCDSGHILSMNKTGALVPPQKTPSPFKILANSTQTSPDDIVNVTIKSTGKEAFRGFFIQMLSRPSPTENGAYIPQSRFLPGEQTTVTSCVNAGDTVLHADESLKETISFLWKAPSLITGPLQLSGSIFEDEDTYWENVLSEPISVIRDHWQKDKPQNAAQTTQVDILNNSQAETISPSYVTINPINTDKSTRNDVYAGKTTFNTVTYRTTAPIKKTSVDADQGVITWNSVQEKTSKKDEPIKTVTMNSGFPFDDQLSKEGIQRREGGSGNTVADRTFYQGLPTVNKSQMIDSLDSFGEFVTPPESSEVLGSAVKSIVGVAGGGGLGTMFKVATTLGRLQRIVGKGKSPKASKLTGYNVKKADGFPLGSLDGIGGPNSLMYVYSNPLALQEAQLLQQQVASQNALLPQTNPYLAQSLGLQGLQNPQLGLQTPQLGLQNPQLAFQNQLGLQNSLLGAQNPNGLQNSQFGMQNSQFGMQTPQLGLGMQGQTKTNPLLGQSQFGMDGLQFGNLPQQNQFGKFMPGQRMGGTGQQLTSQWSGAGEVSPSNMFGGRLGSSVPAGGGNSGEGQGVSGLRRGVDGPGGAGLSGGAGGLGGMLSGLMSGGRGAGGLGSLLGAISPDHLNAVTSLMSGPHGDVLQKSVFDLLNGENGGAIKSAINGMLAGDMSEMGNLQSMLSGSAGDSIRKVVENSLKL